MLMRPLALDATDITPDIAQVCSGPYRRWCMPRKPQARVKKLYQFSESNDANARSDVAE